MKLVIPLLVISFMMLITPSVPTSILPPSITGIANACDEFHGDFNCSCEQSIF
jgi:hypothetical protein